MGVLLFAMAVSATADQTFRAFIARNIGIIETVAAFALVLGFGVWELRRLDRDAATTREDERD